MENTDIERRLRMIEGRQLFILTTMGPIFEHLERQHPGTKAAMLAAVDGTAERLATEHSLGERGDEVMQNMIAAAERTLR